LILFATKNSAKYCHLFHSIHSFRSSHAGPAVFLQIRQTFLNLSGSTERFRVIQFAEFQCRSLSLWPIRVKFIVTSKEGSWNAGKLGLPVISNWKLTRASQTLISKFLYQATYFLSEKEPNQKNKASKLVSVHSRASQSSAECGDFFSKDIENLAGKTHLNTWVKSWPAFELSPIMNWIIRRSDFSAVPPSKQMNSRNCIQRSPYLL
jgi:hypothetical protein